MFHRALIASLLVAALLAPDVQGQSGDRFLGSRPEWTGGAGQVALHDVDGDGHLDLIGGGRESPIINGPAFAQFVTVSRGVGDGTFLAPISIPVADPLRDMHLVDMNNDNRLDIVALTRSTWLLLLIDDGQGGYQLQSQFSLGVFGNQFQNLSIGDLNGDLLPDVATAVSLRGIFVFLNGAQGLQLTQTPTSTAYGESALLDHDGDGNLDLAMRLFPSRVEIRRGDGTGALLPPVMHNIGTQSGLISADFDGDGWDDLASQGSTPPEVRIFLNDKTGGFTAPTRIPLASKLNKFRRMDFDGDGTPDLVGTVGDNYGFLKGLGGLQFAAFVSFPGDAGFQSFARGDLNGDQLPDVVFGLPDGPTVYLADPQGSTELPEPVTGYIPIGVASGDWNEDGFDDVALNTAGSPTFAAVALFGSSQGLQPGPTVTLSSSTSVNGADVNMDGHLDVVSTRGPNQLVLALGDGAGNFALQPAIIVAAANPVETVVDDFNGDGFVDVVTVNDASHNATLLLGDGGGGFTNFFTTPTLGLDPFDIAAGDVDGDGDIDAFVASSGTNSVHRLENPGNGIFVPGPQLNFAEPVRQVTLADVNGDALPDLLIGLDALDDLSFIEIHLADGLGGFSPPSRVAWVSMRATFTLADINGDARLDIAASNGLVAYGDGLGGFGVRQHYGGGTLSVALTHGDYNGDGARDVVTVRRDFQFNRMHVHWNRGPGCAWERYCVAKVNSLGCTPRIRAQGLASASATSGFNVMAQGVRNNKAGLLLYSQGGPAALPFKGGTLCVSTPIKRTPVQNAGGSPAPANDCSGVYALDMNAFAAGLAGGNPASGLHEAGQTVHAQYWSRDQGFPAPNNHGLTDGLRYTVCQ